MLRAVVMFLIQWCILSVILNPIHSMLFACWTLSGKFNNKCKYLHISSAAVYGNPKQLPVKETDNCQPLSPYGWHKWMSELICQEYFRLYNIRSLIVRPFSVYGPGLRKQLFWDLYGKAFGKNSSRFIRYGKWKSWFYLYQWPCKSHWFVIAKKQMWRRNIQSCIRHRDHYPKSSFFFHSIFFTTSATYFSTEKPKPVTRSTGGLILQRSKRSDLNRKPRWKKVWNWLIPG